MIIPYSQKNPKWSKLKIGNTNLDIGHYGCLIVSIASLDGRTPDIILKELNKGNAFTNKGLLMWNRAADLLGYVYKGAMGAKAQMLKPCIMETNYFSPKNPQHFVAWVGHDNLIMDPLTGKEGRNKYPIASYRLFTKGIC